MGNTMPSTSPRIAAAAAEKLTELGKLIRAQRKMLRISATVAAEAAGMSRVTLFRIEKGEPAVTMGAYLNVMAALGLDFGILQPSWSNVADENYAGWIPARIRLADYPQLRQLAWHIRGIEAVTPAEALSIYQRNWRHLDQQALDRREHNLIAALKLGLGEGAGDV